jgi:hypothetical protein
MSTTPAVPIATQLHPISAYLKAHERLVLAGIAAVLLWFAVGHVENIIARHDEANLNQAKVVAQSQADKTAAIAAQVTQQAEEYKALAAQVAAQNAQLEAANVALSNALIKQQHTDATLPPSDLVARWNTLVPQAKPTVTATGIAVDTPSAIATVQALEQVPVLSAQVANQSKELSNAQALVTAEGDQVKTLNTEVGSLNLQLADNQKVCDARVKVVTDAARKSKRRWLYAGMVLGFIGRQLIKSETGF